MHVFVRLVESGLRHVAAAKTPAVHLVTPVTKKPLLQVGWHVEPEVSIEVQLPTLPFVGGADASHGDPPASIVHGGMDCQHSL